MLPEPSRLRRPKLIYRFMFDGLPQKVVWELLFIVINNFNFLVYIKGCPWSF